MPFNITIDGAPSLSSFARITTGTGAPGLKTGTPAYNENENILYYGYGNDGKGNAVTIEAIAGVGLYVDVKSAQTIKGAKNWNDPASFASTLQVVGAATLAATSATSLQVSGVAALGALGASGLISANGGVASVGAVQTHGAAGSIQVYDQSGTGNYGSFYRAGTTNIFFDSIAGAAIFAFSSTDIALYKNTTFTSSLTVQGASSFTGAVSANGGVYTNTVFATGVAAGINLGDRSTTNNSTIYRAGDVTHFADNAGGDVITYSANAITLNKQTVFAGSALVATSQYNTNGFAKTAYIATVGTQASPSTDPSAVVIFQKTSNYGSPGTNATAYASHVKTSSAGGNTAMGFFGEAIDLVGGTQSSVVGLGGHAVLQSGSSGSATGVGASATVATQVFNFAFGAELSIENVAKDAPAIFTVDTFLGACLLDADGSHIADCGVITNPYSPSTFRVGYMVGPTTTTDAGFRCLASCTYGVDLAAPYTKAGVNYHASQANAIRIANNSPLVAMKADFSADLEVLRLDTGNNLLIGAGAAAYIKHAVPFMPTFATAAGSPILPTIDARQANGSSAPVAVAANSSNLIVGAAGLFILTNLATNQCGLYLGDAGSGLVLIGGNGEWVAPTTTPASGHSSIAFDGAQGIRVYNNTVSPASGNPAAASYKVLSLVLR